jgi:hypothetical protein
MKENLNMVYMKGRVFYMKKIIKNMKDYSKVVNLMD